MITRADWYVGLTVMVFVSLLCSSAIKFDYKKRDAFIQALVIAALVALCSWAVSTALTRSGWL